MRVHGSAFDFQFSNIIKYNQMLALYQLPLKFWAYFVVDYVTSGPYDSGTNPKWVSGARPPGRRRLNRPTA
jgi:hypothetical protein